MVSPFIKTVTLKNYKSISTCKVELQKLTFLVGANGAGKSNFLDSLQFVADALTNGLDNALRRRGSVQEVRRKSGGHPNHFAIRLDFETQEGFFGHYSFRIAAEPNKEYRVSEEECRICKDDWSNQNRFRVENGRVVSSTVPGPAVLPDRLALVNFAGTPEFRPVFDALSRIEIYNLNPQEIRRLKETDPSVQLLRDGSNAPGILRQISDEYRSKIDDYLGRIVAGLKGVEPFLSGPYETLEFRQTVKGQKASWHFRAPSMSDGTLRVLGILIATLQNLATGPLLLGLEEPETALHPAALKTLLEALRFASEHRQIVLTSHSSELLDDPDIPFESLLCVISTDGVTTVGSIDEGSRKTLKEHLFTPGELLRHDQISQSEDIVGSAASEAQLKLFELSGKG